MNRFGATTLSLLALATVCNAGYWQRMPDVFDGKIVVTQNGTSQTVSWPNRQFPGMDMSYFGTCQPGKTLSVSSSGTLTIRYEWKNRPGENSSPPATAWFFRKASASATVSKRGSVSASDSLGDVPQTATGGFSVLCQSPNEGRLEKKDTSSGKVEFKISASATASTNSLPGETDPPVANVGITINAGLAERWLDAWINELPVTYSRKLTGREVAGPQGGTYPEAVAELNLGIDNGNGVQTRVDTTIPIIERYTAFPAIGSSFTSGARTGGLLSSYERWSWTTPATSVSGVQPYISPGTRTPFNFPMVDYKIVGGPVRVIGTNEIVYHDLTDTSSGTAEYNWSDGGVSKHRLQLMVWKPRMVGAKFHTIPPSQDPTDPPSEHRNAYIDRGNPNAPYASNTYTFDYTAGRERYDAAQKIAEIVTTSIGPFLPPEIALVIVGAGLVIKQIPFSTVTDTFTKSVTEFTRAKNADPATMGYWMDSPPDDPNLKDEELITGYNWIQCQQPLYRTDWHYTDVYGYWGFDRREANKVRWIQYYRPHQAFYKRGVPGQ